VLSARAVRIRITRRSRRTPRGILLRDALRSNPNAGPPPRRPGNEVPDAARKGGDLEKVRRRVRQLSKSLSSLVRSNASITSIDSIPSDRVRKSRAMTSKRDHES
jgi:hypothetical protein